MAKRPRAPAPKKTKDIVGQIGENALKDLLSAARTADKKNADIALAFGKKKAEAVEKHHLNPKVFAEIKRLNNMEPEELSEYLTVREYYMDISGLTERAASVNRLPLGDELGEDEGGTEEAEAETPARGRGAKIHRPKFGRGRRAAPTAEAAE